MFSTAYRHYVLLMLVIVYTLNYLDRILVVLLLEPIKQDLDLSDTQLGFLTGIAFGLFYATLGVPIARWADRGNRSTIASLAMALWGVTVMASLLVTSFVQLVCARVAAAVGEAGCMPPTYSLVGDYFSGPAERPRAMAIYWLGSPIASLTGFMLGGWLNELYGWRMTFFIMGIPALLIALLVKLTVIEPRGKRPRPDALERSPRMLAVLSILWKHKSSRHLALAIVLLFTMALGLAPWYAAFMMRSHGMRSAELGLWLGLIFGLAGIAGTLIGGFVCSRWLADDERGQMRLSAITVAASVPCFVLFLLLAQKYQALIALIPLVMIFSVFFGPAFALLQRLVVGEMRATTLALVMLLANLIGMGIGPQAVGVMSDLLRPQLGTDSLRYAMLMMSTVALWAAFHFWQVGRTVKRDLGALDGTTAPA